MRGPQIIVLAQIALFLLIVAQVFFLFRVGDMFRRWLRPLIPKKSGVLREFIAALLFLSLSTLVFGVYLFGPAYLVVLAFASTLSVPYVELGRFVPIYLCVSLAVVGVCVKLWPRHFAFCGLTIRSTRTQRDKAAQE